LREEIEDEAGLYLSHGGEAGQGLQTIGAVLAKALARQGLHIFAYQDYYSRVRGGHNFFQIRAASGPVGSHLYDTVHVLVALDEETIKIHRNRVAEGGWSYDSESIPDPQGPCQPPACPLKRVGERSMAAGGHGQFGSSGGCLAVDAGGTRKFWMKPCGIFFPPKGTDIAEANVQSSPGWHGIRQREFQGSLSLCPGWKLEGPPGCF
jgi:hypothetical protein